MSTPASAGTVPPSLVVFMRALAAVVGVQTESAALRFAKREGIPLVKLARRWAVRMHDLESWLAARLSTEDPPTPTAAGRALVASIDRRRKWSS